MPVKRFPQAGIQYIHLNVNYVRIKFVGGNIWQVNSYSITIYYCLI